MEGTCTIEDKEIIGSFDGFTPFELRIGKEAWLVGTHQHKENRICVSHAICKGKLKELMNYLVKKFKTNNVIIYNVLTENWNLRGFKMISMIDPLFKEEVFCLVGKWEGAFHV